MILTVRRAGEDDLDGMIALRTQAEEWLRSNGIAQWTSDYFDYARQVMTSSVEAGTAWIVEDQGEIVGTASLSDTADMDFWSPNDLPNTALYLGKMIVTRSRHRSAIGSSIMNWASARALRHGKQWLRIDVRRDNRKLHEYYLRHGFVHVRTVRPCDRRTESGWLAQRPAGLMTPNATVLS